MPTPACSRPQLRRREAGWGAAEGERIIHRMTNSIRPGRLASPLGNGEAQTCEPQVWTKRMLAALETGVTGGKWYSLIDKVHPEGTLRAAFTRVAANRGAAGVDHVTVEQFASDVGAEVKDLSEALRTGSYRPQAIRRHYIPKPGGQEMRQLGIPTVRNRVVQTALRMVMEPIS